MQKFCFYTGGASPSPTIYNHICIKHRSLNFKTNFINRLEGTHLSPFLHIKIFEGFSRELFAKSSLEWGSGQSPDFHQVAIPANCDI